MMRVGGPAIAVLLLLATSSAQQMAPDLPSILAGIRAKDAGQLAVSEEDGRFLRLLIASSKRKRALEIGGASGYSAIWMAQGLRETGGKLVTIEYDPARARELADNIRKAGMNDVVQVIAGDAFAEIPKLPGTFDFVFLDAWKRDYKRFLDLVLPVSTAAVSSRRTTSSTSAVRWGIFWTRFSTILRLWTTIVSPANEGISLSYKR